MHASTQTKGICVQHRIIGIDQLTQSTKLPILARRMACLRHHLRLPARWWWLVELVTRRSLLRRLLLVELRRVCTVQLVGGRVGDVVAVDGLVEHGAALMRIVLLFCTHGINLGRTQFYWGRRRGQLAELIYMFLEWGGVVLRWRRACITTTCTVRWGVAGAHGRVEALPARGRVA